MNSKLQTTAELVERLDDAIRTATELDTELVLYDVFAREIRDRLEQLERARQVLSDTHKLISEFAMSGFTDDEIGHRLYANQGTIARALTQSDNSND